ncbi:septum formation family protein [Psychrobacter sp. I-STPA10]|uniref:septum formation family protein n=1 Tax=Psychrobacter sp. I-STPA10 TaxID=2585769 RepID=UPI001E400252|nr:septum formation family protein [Psychrobacter sp. I-STPA10]
MPQKNTAKNTPAANISRSSQQQATSCFSYLLMALMSVGVVSMLGCSVEQREQAEQTLSLDEKDVFSLQVGTCFNDANGNIDSGSGEEISEVPIRDCDKPHDYEVFHLFNLTGDNIPTDEDFETQVMENCDPAFESYVGKSFEESMYNMSTLSPSLDTWQTGDREVVCFLFDESNAKLTESLKGKNL